MAVQLPTAAGVRKAREQAAKTAAERAEAARTPLLAVLGAGEAAYAVMSKAALSARDRAFEARTQAEGVQQRLRNDDLRDDLRKAFVDLQHQLEVTYAELAKRGEATWGRIRKQPQVKQAIATIESYTEQLDSRVDGWVDDAHDAAEKALGTITRQTRSSGERWAQATQRLSGRAAETVTEVSKDASKAVAKAGAGVAEEITEAGAEAAHETRSTTRRAANRTEPKQESAKPAARKPAARRTDGTSSKPTS
jgi:heparin binding hemagglutinin HbhA